VIKGTLVAFVVSVVVAGGVSSGLHTPLQTALQTDDLPNPAVSLSSLNRAFDRLYRQSIRPVKQGCHS
jgi:hypothetical protein